MSTLLAPANTADLPSDHNSTTVVEEAMPSVFGMPPHDWQQDSIHHIITLAKDNSCAPLLLVRPTGGGRLAVRDTVGLYLKHLFWGRFRFVLGILPQPHYRPPVKLENQINLGLS
jgi:hypothetical protein